MRHHQKRNRLSRPADQRKAVLRSLASSLFQYGEIKTTLSKAKALKPYAESIVTLAKKGDLSARRQALKFIYDIETDKFMDRETWDVFEKEEECKKLMPQTVLRKLFSEIGKKYADRNGGYTRIYHLPPRRGDAAPMALIQLV